MIVAQPQMGVSEAGVSFDGLVEISLGALIIPEGQPNKAGHGENLGFSRGKSEGGLDGVPGPAQVIRPQPDFGQIDISRHKTRIGPDGLFQVPAGRFQVKGGDINQGHGDLRRGGARITF